MKNHPVLCRFFILLCVLPGSSRLFSQQNFDIQTYKSFLSANAGLTAEGLRSLYPAGTFNAAVGVPLDSVAWLDSIDHWYHFTEEEKTLLSRNGFMVTERLSARAYGRAYLDVFHHDLPVFISADAILHAIHRSYDVILMDVEQEILIRQLRSLLRDCSASLPVLASRYETVDGMSQPLDDLDCYLTVARKLLGDTVDAARPGAAADVARILPLISAQQFAEVPLFSTKLRKIDFSQFTPRGHYTLTPALTAYFQSMIWLGRTEFQILPAQGTLDSQDSLDLKRQTVDAFLILEAIDVAADSALCDSIDSVIRTFVGESDNITVANLRFLRDAMSGPGASAFLSDSTLAILASILREQSFAIQRINSQVLIVDPMSPEAAQPPAAFLLLGQRFVIDSYVTGSVVYDKISYQGNKVMRMLPSTLDVLFATGNDAAAQLLAPELEKYHYAPNLAALRYLIDSYDTTFWNGSLYNLWLNAIRTLNPPGDRSALPGFMQTAAWWQEKMNTQLTSWSQLRHDNLLYAKQSYTGGAICSFPEGYVEPVPKFYHALRGYILALGQRVTDLPFQYGWTGSRLTGYCSHSAACLDTLEGLAQHELDRTEPDPEESGFISRMLYEGGGCVPTMNGWYARMFYANPQNDCDSADFVVADIHTQPTDELGNYVGKVLHVGTGMINQAVVIAEPCPGERMAFIGPVGSYAEYVTLDFKRLNDEEWKALAAENPPPRPDWVNCYLADNSGTARPAGPMLMTDVPPDVHPPAVPREITLDQNFPNPFNPSTVIGFTIPGQHAGPVTLSVYDVVGRLVRMLVHEDLPGGQHYITRWDGTNDGGLAVSSGVYWYRLTADGRSESKMMLLVR